jgi:nitroimidazol reductase NimA-like FMN-containing flavoprotein (pyridoxamine 5'-phosphate oxidase superfamily)
MAVEDTRVIEDVPKGECLSLLTTQNFGRLALVVDGAPMVVPVNYGMHGDTIVIRTDEGTKLDASPMSDVAFEVDDVSHSTHAGWSVLVRGVAQDITDALDELSIELRAIPIDTWAPGRKSHWLTITPRLVTGRRLRTKQVASADPRI